MVWEPSLDFSIGFILRPRRQWLPSSQVHQTNGAHGFDTVSGREQRVPRPTLSGFPSRSDNRHLAKLQLNRLRFGLLQLPHLRISPTYTKQVPVGAAFDNPASFQYQNFVGVDDGRQAVRDG